MKRLALYALAGLLLAACASHEVAPTPAPPDPRSSVAAMVTGCAEAVKDIAIAAGGDAASKVAAVGAIERLCGGGANQLQLAVQQPQPQSVAGVLWQSAIQVADLFLRGYGIKASRDVAVVQSNNQANTTIASYGAFSQMGGSIERAGTAGYPYVQAPGAVTTTTNTLSGTGVLGSGSYIGPVTRTCAGGQAGGGVAGTATVPGAPGGPGGPATC